MPKDEITINYVKNDKLGDDETFIDPMTDTLGVITIQCGCKAYETIKLKNKDNVKVLFHDT